MERSLEQYRDIVGDNCLDQLKDIARHLSGKSIVHVNSTRAGGGVAEILNWLVAFMAELGLKASWEVIDGTDEFFRVTKMFHNGLQGNDVPFTETERKIYEQNAVRNAEKLRAKLEAADYVFIHDPQPAHLINLCPNRKGKWVWRCHIDASNPDPKVWNYLSKIVAPFDASIFSMPEFARKLPHSQFIIAPSIDPLSEKNREMSSGEVDELMTRYSISRDLPLITQVSRFDRFKDPLGVVEAFKIVRRDFPCRLILAGAGAADDPEGSAVHAEVLKAVGRMPDVMVMMLPEDALFINALQRASAIVVQKSVKEGFGLTVTEALWKKKPVIGGNTGGIKIQVKNYETGFLVNTPQEAADRIRELLKNPEMIGKIGEKAHWYVRENFLLTRQLRDYMSLISGFTQGFASYLKQV
ncbi:MAG: glycosyltransferase [Candidatus Wallbacteria bacterium]|nr:glycosyltransferase [Candidatus Wallbacteria bacterium]